MASDAEEDHMEHLEAKFLVDKQKRIENAMSWHPKQEKLIKSWGKRLWGTDGSIIDVRYATAFLIQTFLLSTLP